VIFAMVLTFIIVFSITDWYVNKEKVDDNTYTQLQDNTRFLNSFLSTRIDSQGTILDAIINAHITAQKQNTLNYGEFGRKLQTQINTMFKEDRCIEIYIDGIEEYSTNLLSCTPRIDAETKYPTYGKELNIRLVVG